MQNCAITLDHPGCRPYPGIMHTLESIVRYLPSQSESRRAKDVKPIGLDVYDANLRVLTDCLDRQARIADNRFIGPQRDSGRLTKQSTRLLQYILEDDGRM